MAGHLDGNALAGSLSELFRFDPTTAMGRCSHCGDVRTLAGSLLYASDIGSVLRCAGCDHALVTVVRRPGGVSLSTAGLSWIRFATDD